MKLTGFKNNSSGFTLLELLIVTAILGILASITFTLLQPSVIFGQVRDTRRKGDLQEIAKALQQYYNDNKSYPDSFGAWQNVNVFFVQNGGGPVLVPGYSKLLPKDPDPVRVYEYISSGTAGTCDTNQMYALKVILERVEDPQAYDQKQIPTWCDGTTPVDFGPVLGTYYVTSN